MDLDQVGLERAFDGEDRLDQKRVGVLEVQVHDGHHADAHELGAHQLPELLLVVFHDGRRHGTGFFAGAHRSGLNVFEGGQICQLQSVASFQILWAENHTLLFVDLGLDIEVDAQDDHIGHNVQSTDAEEHIRVVERNPLGDLHHPEDDDEVGTIAT